MSSPQDKGHEPTNEERLRLELSRSVDRVLERLHELDGEDFDRLREGVLAFHQEMYDHPIQP